MKKIAQWDPNVKPTGFFLFFPHDGSWWADDDTADRLAKEKQQ